MTISNFDIDAYCDRLDEIESQIKKLNAEKKEINASVLEYYKEDIEERYASKGSNFGVAKVVMGDVVIEVNNPKKIDWDQSGLRELRDEIAKHEDASVYIQEKLSVSETAYKKWPKNIQKAFDKHRTVNDGTKTVKIMRSKD